MITLAKIFWSQDFKVIFCTNSTRQYVPLFLPKEACESWFRNVIIYAGIAVEMLRTYKNIRHSMLPCEPLQRLLYLWSLRTWNHVKQTFASNFYQLDRFLFPSHGNHTMKKLGQVDIIIQQGALSFMSSKLRMPSIAKKLHTPVLLTQKHVKLQYYPTRNHWGFALYPLTRN